MQKEKMQDLVCPLCEAQGREFYEQEYIVCDNCGSIFKGKNLFLLPDEERGRYELHNNDAQDVGYQKFVSPITDAILEEFTPLHVGLDFGSGRGSAISKVLSDNDFNIFEYDLFFNDDRELLQQKYDYIACCEVIEHFHNPKKEFALLRSLLKDGGKLYCKTHPYDDSIDFGKWYYRKDPTHVFFYKDKSFEHIREAFGFKDVKIEGRLIIFEG